MTDAVGREAIKTAPTLAGLRARRDEILALAARYGASNVRVFGSVARGEATADNDIDFLVSFAPGYTLLMHSGLLVRLIELLGQRVEVVNEPQVRDEYRAFILHDSVLL